MKNVSDLKDSLLLCPNEEIITVKVLRSYKKFVVFQIE